MNLCLKEGQTIATQSNPDPLLFFLKNFELVYLFTYCLLVQKRAGLIIDSETVSRGLSLHIDASVIQV